VCTAYRCTALEQDRQYLTQQLSDASGALNEGAAARSRLQAQLAQSTGDREEAVRLNLNLQVCVVVFGGGLGGVIWESCDGFGSVKKLAQSTGDREEAVRLNLNLQVCEPLWFWCTEVWCREKGHWVRGWVELL
jgi:hypothetical protein